MFKKFCIDDINVMAAVWGFPPIPCMSYVERAEGILVNVQSEYDLRKTGGHQIIRLASELAIEEQRQSIMEEVH